MNLHRSQVDLAKRMIRLEPTETKEGYWKRVPLHREAVEVLATAMEVRALHTEHVFLIQDRMGIRRAGLEAYKNCWPRACKALRWEKPWPSCTHFLAFMNPVGPRKPMKIDIIDDELIMLVPDEHLRAWRPIPIQISSFGKAEIGLSERPDRRARGLKNPEVRSRDVALDALDSPHGFIVDETEANILQFIWNSEHEELIIKADYPGLPIYMKKYLFEQAFLAIEMWEQFTFLFYLRLMGAELKKSVKHARTHRHRDPGHLRQSSCQNRTTGIRQGAPQWYGRIASCQNRSSSKR